MLLTINKNLSNVSVVWSLISNEMFVRYMNTWKKFLITQSAFLRLRPLKKEISDFQVNIYFLIFSLKKKRYYNMCAFFQFFYFLTKLNLNESPLKVGFYILVDLVGLGFKVIKITEKLFFFELGWASGVYFFVPKVLKVSISFKKKKILIFGYDIHSVLNMVTSLVLLRKMSPYRIGGFMQHKVIIRLRTGKQR